MSECHSIKEWVIKSQGNKLSVHFPAVCDIKNRNDFMIVINGVYCPIITCPQSMVLGIAKSLNPKGARIGFKGKYLVANTTLNVVRKFRKLFLRACRYVNRILHEALRVLSICLRNEPKRFVFSELRFTAIARSITSSLRWLSLIIVKRNALCSSFGSALNAVRNTCTVACFAVICLSSLQIKYSTLSA